MTLRSSILIPSFQRPQMLAKCLRSLAAQTQMPDEVIVVWQANDTATRDAAEQLLGDLRCDLRVLHSETRGVVPAENVALDASRADVILLIDDDAIAPVDWVARHLAHYADPTIGAVGGPAVNHTPEGTTFPQRTSEPIGRLFSAGRLAGNMYDHPPAWRSRPPIDVDHLVGYNMSLRRAAFNRFDENLRAYWCMFELDACLQVKSRGFRVRFDFANVVEHHPLNTVYAAGREGDLNIKIYNVAYNHAYILARHRRSRWQRTMQAMYFAAVGNVNAPGALATMVAMARFGHPFREMRILWNTLKARRAGRRAAREFG